MLNQPSSHKDKRFNNYSKNPKGTEPSSCLCKNYKTRKLHLLNTTCVSEVRSIWSYQGPQITWHHSVLERPITAEPWQSASDTWIAVQKKTQDVLCHVQHYSILQNNFNGASLTMTQMLPQRRALKPLMKLLPREPHTDGITLLGTSMVYHHTMQ